MSYPYPVILNCRFMSLSPYMFLYQSTCNINNIYNLSPFICAFLLFLKFLSTSFFHFLPSSPELLRSAGKYELEHNQ